MNGKLWMDDKINTPKNTDYCDKVLYIAFMQYKLKNKNNDCKT